MNSPDITLISLVKNKQDSEALTELVNRHTGIYVNIVNKSAISDNDKKELIDNRFYNIYKYVLEFDESRGAKFSTYVYNSTGWTCKKTAKQSPYSREIINDNIIGPNADISVRDTEEYIINCLDMIEDKRFAKIFNYRHSTEKPLGWREIGKTLGLSHEGVRKIYNTNIKLIREKLQAEIHEYKLSSGTK